jgi:hypothetical protein
MDVGSLTTGIGFLLKLVEFGKAKQNHTLTTSATYDRDVAILCLSVVAIVAIVAIVAVASYRQPA